MRSANIFLARETEGDVYGTWRVCRFRIGMVDPGQIIGTSDVIPLDGVTPFGVDRPPVLFDYVANLNLGGVHQLICDLVNNEPGEEFVEIVAEVVNKT